MERFKSSAEIAKELGLSKERVNQFARTHNLQRIGNIFVWAERDKEALQERIGCRGIKLNVPAK